MDNGTDWIVVEDLGCRLRASEDYVVLRDEGGEFWIPTVIELEDIAGAGDPLRSIRVEVDGRGSRLTHLAFAADDPDSLGIRQIDLRDIEVAALTKELVAGFTMRIERRDGEVSVTGSLSEPDRIQARHAVERLREGRSGRAITTRLLKDVAQTYRTNVGGHPNKAIEHRFQVSQRTAAGYVQEARRRGLLPPTTRGKKKA